MSMIKRNLETQISNLAKASGYAVDELTSIYEQCVEESGGVEPHWDEFAEITTARDW